MLSVNPLANALERGSVEAVDAGDGAGGRVARRTVLGSWALFAVLAAGFTVADLLGVALPLRYRALAYLLLMGTVSLYHGGFEHVANLRGRGESMQVRYLLAYLTLIVLAYALFVLSPVAGLAAALTITALKAGHGGLAVLERLTGASHVRTAPQRALAVVVRGGAVVVPAYLVHPGLYRMYAGYMVGVFDRGALEPFAWAFAPATVEVVGTVYGVLVGLHLLAGLAATGLPGETDAAAFRSWTLDAGETLLLVAFFLTVPPALAIGVYFPCWYAARGAARLAAGPDAPADSARELISHVARGGAVVYVAALALFGLGAVLIPQTPVSAAGWVGYYSVAVAVIAVPHVIVGSYLDRRQGIWSV